jgi:pilus assembly protein CpaE
VSRAVCLHRLSEIKPESLPGFSIAAYTTARQELLTALGTLNVAGLVLDLDQPDAVNTIITALELKPSLGIVGVTSGRDIKLAIAAQRAGCAQFATRPLDANDLAAALRQAISRTPEAQAVGRTIAVLGAIGGAGSTTIACHLAVELAQSTASTTALFDFDLEFGGVARAFDLKARYTVADLASAGAVDSFLLDKTAVKLPAGVHVFARPRTIREAHEIDETAAAAILRAAGLTYRYLIVDVPHRLDPITGAAIEGCDKLLLVLQLTVPSLDNAARMLDVIAAEGIPKDRIEIVVNRYRKNMHSCTVEMVEKQLGYKVLTVVPSDYQSVRSAIDVGKPLGKRSPVRSAIRAAAVRFARQDMPPRRKTWLAKLGLRS